MYPFPDPPPVETDTTKVEMPKTQKRSWGSIKAEYRGPRKGQPDPEAEDFKSRAVRKKRG